MSLANHLARSVATAAVFGFAGLSAAFAADAPAGAASGAVMEACAQDFKTLCGEVEPGEGRLKACIKEHRAKLSTGCKKALREARKAKS